jgi:hypothetical protein
VYLRRHGDQDTPHTARPLSMNCVKELKPKIEHNNHRHHHLKQSEGICNKDRKKEEQNRFIE